MSDVVVVGAGYWGVAAALMAEAAGASVTLVSAQLPGSASVASSGYFSERWYKGTFRAAAEQAFDDAKNAGVQMSRPGNVVNGSLPHVKGDWWMFWPDQYLGLRTLDRRARVTQVAPARVTLDTGEVLDCKSVLLACGAFTDDLLTMSGLPSMGVVGLGGTGLIYEGQAPQQLVLHQLNVYKQYAIRQWGPGLVRIGETVEPKPERHDAYVASMEKVMQPYVTELGLRKVGSLHGLRPVLKSGMEVREVAPGVFAATGGGRIGAVPAFWAAREFVRRGLT